MFIVMRTGCALTAGKDREVGIARDRRARVIVIHLVSVNALTMPARSLAAALLLTVASCKSGNDPAAQKIAVGARVFKQCTACHTIGEYAADADAPNLWGVVGAPVAQRRPRYGYTAALRSFGGNWSTRRLDAWLTDPRRMVPGTSMAFGGLRDPRDRAAVIAYLETQKP